MKSNAKQHVIRVGKIVFNVLFYSVIIFLILFSIANMKLNQKDDIANIFGYGFTTVLSDSMDGDKEDSFTMNDIVFVQILNDESRSKLEVGDIVTYFSMEIPGLGVQGLITHRITEIIQLDNEVFLVTTGDKDGAFEDAPIHISEAIAIYQSKWVGAGSSLKYLQTPTGFALFVILPVIFMLIFEAVLLIRNVIKLNNEKLEKKFAFAKENPVFDMEAEKEKIRQQVIEEMKNQNKS